MKDIIAAQQVQRRRKSSLLTSASAYRAITKPALTTGQDVKPHRSSVLHTLFARRQPMVRQEGPGPVKTAAAAWFCLSPKRRLGISAALGGVIILAVLFFVAGFNFIPDPEPPEDTIVLDHAASYGSALLQSEDIPLDLMETFSWQHYTVRSGDSVEAIARRFGLSLDAVITSNNIRNVRRELRIGEIIRIPNMDGVLYTVRRGDSYAKIAKSQGVPLEAVLDANDIQDGSINPGAVLFIPGARMQKDELRQALGELFVYPLKARLTSRFGWRNDPFTGVRLYHAGLDLAAPLGTPVKASADGKVSAAGFNNIYGNFIILTHSNGYKTMYGHLEKRIATAGTYVSQGTVIGLVGSTGRSTGPHLHFAAYKNDRAINPLEILNK